MLKHVFFFFLLLIPFSAQSSGVATFKGMDNGKPYKKTSRVDMDDNSDIDSYLLFKEKSAQVITAYQGNTLVMDLANVSQMAQGLGVMSVLGIDSESLSIRVIRMDPTGKKEKVAGVEGEVYKLTWTRNNVKQQDELVLSKDSRVWEYTEAWVNAIDAISISSPSINIQGDELLNRVSNDKVGILRLGKRFRLVSVKNGPVSPARFVAPDTSFTIPGLGDLLGGL
jgi:hypothetical protein